MTVLAVLGPTASGKSALALEIARRRQPRPAHDTPGPQDAADADAAVHAPTGHHGHDVEVVAIDAFTVYRGMDVGTAKVAPQVRDEIPHHLVDVLDPAEELTVARFQRLARAAIDDVLARARTPLLVGGSGLYWRAVVDDLRFPPTDAAVRTDIEARWVDDPAGAHAHLAAQDPDAAAGIPPENLRRTIRALEVIELTGERFSTYDSSWDDYRSIYDDLAVGYLEPDAEVLRARIHERAAQMVAGGLLDEAAALRAQPEPLSRTAAQAIGYAEAFAVLDGDLAPDALARTIAVRTWRYAKRQRAWFRADPRCEPRQPHEILADLVAAGTSER